MGAAAGIVGLGMQAVGTFSSTNTNSLDKSNAYAIKVAESNAQQQEALLNQQAAAADQFTKYQYDQQMLMYQGQRQLAEQQLESQYQSNLYQNQIETLQNEVQRYGQKISSELQKASYNLEYENQLKSSKLNKLENDISLQASNLSRNAKRNDIEASKGLQNIQNNLETSKLQLTDVGIRGQQGQINVQKQGLQNDAANLQLSESAARRGLDTQAAQGNIGQMQGEQSAYNQKGDFYRQLLSQFTGNEKEFNKYAARLNALGIDTGIQGSSLSNDMNNNSDMYNQQQSQRNQFGQQVGGAALQNEMIQAQVKGGREDVRNQGILRRNALGVQEMGLRQGEANLANQWANNQLGARALDTQKVQQEIERHSLLQSLSMEDTYDIFSKQLLPNLRNSWSDTSAQQKLGLQTASQGVTDYQNDMNYNLTNMGLSREREANYTNTSNAEDLLDADYARQVQATEAAYNSSLGTNQSSLAAALAQIASNQYGVLSSLSSGGGGGGFNWGGLSGLISQAAQIFGGMSGNGSSGTQGYSTYNNSYGTQSSNFSRRSSGSGQYAGTQSNGVF